MECLPLISIIVPVFNVERYIHRAIDSLLSQTYTELEIILVDDGSSDKSGDICDSYAKKYKNIISVHQKNGGQGKARNVGLSLANGTFIGFIDSDDWVEVNMYEYLYTLIHTYKADAAQIAFRMPYKYSSIEKQPIEKIDEYEGKEVLQFLMSDSTVATGAYSLCRCLFKKECLSEVSFREGKINEDIDYKYRVLSNCRKFIVSNQIMYSYFQDSNSTTRGGLKRKDFDLREASTILYDLTKGESYGTIEKLGRVKMARTAFSLLSKIAYYGVSDDTIDEKKVTKELLREHRSNLLVLLGSPMSFSRKVLSVMYAINYPMSKALIRLVRK